MDTTGGEDGDLSCVLMPERRVISSAVIERSKPSPRPEPVAGRRRRFIGLVENLGLSFAGRDAASANRKAPGLQDNRTYFDRSLNSPEV